MTVNVKRILDSTAMTRALQVAAALSLLIAIVVGIRQYTLASCLADYSDESAQATAARAAAAAEDRKADETDRQANEADRVAFRQVIDALATQDQAKTRIAFVNLVATYQRTDLMRTEAVQARVENERKRRDNPPPEPPSLRCG